MLPRNLAVIAGLRVAIKMVEDLDKCGVELPGAFVVNGEEPWFAGPVGLAPPPGPVLPFGPRTKGGAK